MRTLRDAMYALLCFIFAAATSAIAASPQLSLGVAPGNREMATV
jgi:hypothetical protein